MYRKILIVEDNDMNRKLLRRMLGQEYDVLEAQNGIEALKILRQDAASISAVILDLIMPEMNGLEVLEKMQEDPEMQQLPVIVATGSDDKKTEGEALRSGAIDYITKPYIPELLKNRLRNTIKLREQAAIVNATKTDALTGLLSRAAFFEHTIEMVAQKNPGFYVMACFNINRFRVLNDQYGNQKGDNILKQIATILEEDFEKAGGIVARIMADKFAVLYPREHENTEEIKQTREKASKLDGSILPITFSIGRYYVKDTSLEPSAMYDRAVMAMESVKGRYDTHVGVYNESMRDKLINEQTIISEMKKALDDGQFKVWYQPQFNHATGAIVGAEALVRWIHPEKGIISPSDFVPIFEKNGFIYEMDKYVWEQVCIFLKRKKEETNQIIPVSVNVSRYDIFCDDLIDVLLNLINKYEIPIECLRLEITESAFTNSNEQIIDVIKKFSDLGFVVEIDDFGSGYSSLNTLKDVPANILKLDMRFVEGEDNQERGGNILESIVRMARWIGMSVIAEGVEEPEQADFLKSIGCYYIQGYLYSKPIPQEEYEKIIKDRGNAEKMSVIEKVNTYDAETFWNPKSMDTVIFNSFVGGACIFEYKDGVIDIIRVNDKYEKILNGECKDNRSPINLDWERFIIPASKKSSRKAMMRAIATGEEVSDEMELRGYREAGKSIFLHCLMKVIAHIDNRYLFYCILEDITAQREAERKERLLSSQLDIILSDVYSGVSVCTYSEEGKPELVFANDRFYEQRGYTKEQYLAEVTNVFDSICQEDMPMLIEKGQQVVKDHKPAETTYRLIRRDGSIAWIRSRMSVTVLEGYENPLQIAISDDITREQEAVTKEEGTNTLLQMIMDNVGSGITATIVETDSVRFLFANDIYYSMLGYTSEQYHSEIKNYYSLIHPEDRDRIYSEVHSIALYDKPLVTEFRAICRNSSIKKIRMVTVNKEFHSSRDIVQLSVFEDITEERKDEEQRKELIENMPCGAGILDISGGTIRGIYLNTRYWQMVGREPVNTILFPVMQSVKLEDRAYLSIVIQRMIVSGKEQECEIHVLTGAGSYIPILARGKVKKHKSGRHIMYVTYTPITEETLTYRQMLPVVLETMLASSSDYSFVKDRTMTYVCASHAFADMLGVDNERDIIGKNDYDLFDDYYADMYREDDKHVLKSGKPMIDHIEELPTKNGSSRYSCTSKYLLRDASGNIIGLYGVGRDITEDKEAFSRLQLLTDTIPGGLATYEVTNEGINVKYLSDGVYQLTGYDKDEYDLSKNDPLCFVMEEDRQELQKNIDNLYQNGTTISCICRVLRKNGECHWIDIRGQETERKKNSVMVNTVMFDVTDQKKTNIKLNLMERENWNRYEHELLLRKGLIKDSLLYYQLNLTTDTFEEFDSKYQDMPMIKRGVKLSPMLQQAILNRVLSADAEKVRNMLFSDNLRLAYEQGERNISAIYRRLLPDGNYHWVKTDAFMMEKPDNGNIIAFLHCKDIDKEQKMQMAFETILGEDIETIIYVNTKTGEGNIAHMREELNHNHLNGVFNFRKEYACYCEEVVIEEDQKNFSKFYDISYLEERLGTDRVIQFDYRTKEKKVIRRKLAKAYFLDGLKDVIILTSRDITELYQEEQKQKKELQQAVDKANQASQAKSDFLSRMSHDIRTPLNAVLSFSNKELLAGSSEDKMREYLDKINISGKYLLGIINDVLDMSRIEQNRIVLNPEPYLLSEFEETIHNVIDEFSKSRNITFIMDTSKTKMHGIMVDKIRFNQIFVNLLSNAVKFTRRGGKVEFIIEEVSAGKKNKAIMHYIVRDNGIGMSKEFVPHAFESFNQEYRKDSSEKDQGTGLGLAIVNELVKMMGGTIKLESELNVGTTFTIDFPIDDVIPFEKKTTEPVHDYSIMDGVHILLVEDNKINTEIARALLQKQGCLVECAENGEVACQKYKDSLIGFYDIILMDIRMPIMDGLTATKKIRAMKRKDAKTVPIISMTADAFNEDEKTAYNAGMNAYVAKPINPHKLYDTCCTFLEEALKSKQ